MLTINGGQRIPAILGFNNIEMLVRIAALILLMEGLLPPLEHPRWS